MKAFDLERAKAGEPIEVRDGEEWKPVRFVGTLANGKVVSEEVDLGVLHVAIPLYMRMARRKKVKWYCLMVKGRGGRPTLLHHTSPPEWDTTMQWLGAPFTLEVEQE